MKTYTIQPGDSLGTIAKEFYGNSIKYKEIAKANNIANPNAISVGQKIILPGIETITNTPPAPILKKAPTANILTPEILAEIMPLAKTANIQKYTAPLNIETSKFSINTPLRIANFIAQLAHESGSFNFTVENLNYSSKALRLVFGKYFSTTELADSYARQPEKIANRVYANRMGNGDENSGDGWRFRGRGLIQLTGKDNYTQCGTGLQLDLIANPEQLANNPTTAVAAACWFWDSRNLNTYADQDNIKAITKRINGGYNGLADREAYLTKAKTALGV